MSACKHIETSYVGTHGYRGSVAQHPFTRENQAAHGGVTHTEQCDACGSRRFVNTNGRHEEVGCWGPARSEREASARAAAARATRLLEAIESFSARASDGRIASVRIDTDGMVCVDGAEGQDAVRVAASLPGWLARAKAARLAIVEAREAATRV